MNNLYLPRWVTYCKVWLMQMTSNTCQLTLLWQHPCETALYTVKRFPSSLLILCWLWAGKDFAKTLKTILFTKLTSYLLSEDVSLCFNRFCTSGLFVCLISWKSHLEVKKLFFFKVIYPYNDCIDKTSEMWMMCLVSELCPSFLLFYFKTYWCWKCEFSAWTIFL